MEQSKYVATIQAPHVVNDDEQQHQHQQLSSSTMTYGANSCKYSDMKKFNTYDFSDITNNLSKRFTKIKLPNPDKENLELFYSNNPNKDIHHKENTKQRESSSE